MYQDALYVDIAVDIELLVFSWILQGLCCIIDFIHYIIHRILLLCDWIFSTKLARTTYETMIEDKKHLYTKYLVSVELQIYRNISRDKLC